MGIKKFTLKNVSSQLKIPPQYNLVIDVNSVMYSLINNFGNFSESELLTEFVKFFKNNGIISLLARAKKLFLATDGRSPKQKLQEREARGTFSLSQLKKPKHVEPIDSKAVLLEAVKKIVHVNNFDIELLHHFYGFGEGEVKCLAFDFEDKLPVLAIINDSDFFFFAYTSKEFEDSRNVDFILDPKRMDMSRSSPFIPIVEDISLCKDCSSTVFKTVSNFNIKGAKLQNYYKFDLRTGSIVDWWFLWSSYVGREERRWIFILTSIMAFGCDYVSGICDENDWPFIYQLSLDVETAMIKENILDQKYIEGEIDYRTISYIISFFFKRIQVLFRSDHFKPIRYPISSNDAFAYFYRIFWMLAYYIHRTVSNDEKMVLGNITFENFSMAVDLISPNENFFLSFEDIWRAFEEELPKKNEYMTVFLNEINN